MVPQTAVEAEPRCVLIVEDQLLVRMLLADALRDAGVQVVEARSGDDALDYLRSGARVDLIFSDVQMPGMVDGVELARRVHEETPNLPVILTSGNGKPQDMNDARQFVPKPYELAYVVTLVLRSLGIENTGANT